MVFCLYSDTMPHCCSFFGERNVANYRTSATQSRIERAKGKRTVYIECARDYFRIPKHVSVARLHLTFPRRRAIKENETVTLWFLTTAYIYTTYNKVVRMSEQWNRYAIRGCKKKSNSIGKYSTETESATFYSSSASFRTAKINATQTNQSNWQFWSLFCQHKMLFERNEKIAVVKTTHSLTNHLIRRSITLT